MPKVTSFLFGMFVGAVVLYMSENYYIVRSKETVNLIPKVASKVELPYYDIRSYTAADWERHPSLALAIVQSKKQDLLIESGLTNMQSQLEGFLRTLQR